MRIRNALLFLVLFMPGLWGQNQTADLSPILSPDTLPYRVSITLADFQLPSDPANSYGLQSFAFAVYHHKWLLLAGRTNGLHGFNNGPPVNFPPSLQNTTVIVVDPIHKTVVSRSLSDPSSHLTQAQIDTLSVTTPQYYQVDKTLYLAGGYGVDTATGLFGTKSILTAIDIPGLMSWVEKGKKSAAQSIRQTSHPLIQVAGGYMTQVNGHQPFLLVFGENFTGDDISVNGTYTQQVRPFRIIDNGRDLYVYPDKQFATDPSYRRTDLSVMPVMQKSANGYIPAVVALSGVFTSGGGIWTVPVLINGDGSSSMKNPALPSTFKQGMNSFDCARLGLFSKRTNDMYILLFGGISYLFLDSGVIDSDSELPFINSVTTVKIDSDGNFQQYLMEGEYPVIASQFSNPGNTLLFGAEARFIPAEGVASFSNGVFSLDELGSSPILLGYIVGGIQSTVPNTNSQADSAASPYIFSVYLEKR